MKLRKPNSKFYRWWNSYTGRRIISATYSLGAAVVIMGAMFKILHLPLGNYMLGIGMTVESLIFALGIFDKPYREYDWSKIFNFKAEEDERLNVASVSSALSGGPIPTGIIKTGENGSVLAGDFQPGGGVVIAGYPASGVDSGATSDAVFPADSASASTTAASGGGVIIAGYPVSGAVSGATSGAASGAAFPADSASASATAASGGGGVILPAGTLAEEDVKRLSEGIKNLTETAEQLQLLANVAVAANGLAHNIESASEIAATFADTQQKLNSTAESLTTSYQHVNSEVNKIVTETHGYSGNVESVNRTLISINSIYEIQLRHLQAQTENLNRQAEAIRLATEHVDGVAADMDKMKEAATFAQLESQRYQEATRKLSKQVEDLNAIYGNMLNALS